MGIMARGDGRITSKALALGHHCGSSTGRERSRQVGLGTEAKCRGTGSERQGGGVGFPIAHPVLNSAGLLAAPSVSVFGGWGGCVWEVIDIFTYKEDLPRNREHQHHPNDATGPGIATGPSR